MIQIVQSLGKIQEGRKEFRLVKDSRRSLSFDMDAYFHSSDGFFLLQIIEFRGNQAEVVNIWNIFGIYLEYIWNKFGIYLEYIWNIFGIYFDVNINVS